MEIVWDDPYASAAVEESTNIAAEREDTRNILNSPPLKPSLPREKRLILCGVRKQSQEGIA